ncbi:putative MFS monocarboxylate transporter [Vararia minispora EC-137]|uniref:MFS monocarboxylate transporter n=1 Tax=Vararia minispora EC-137 TaxID=1314806 RepID=A0ACB8QLK8_9AGAM|nr:putative MFS monocarboxylate transporter [Vararia minispora EC-137]
MREDASREDEKHDSTTSTRIIEPMAAETEGPEVALPPQELDVPDGGLVGWLQVVSGFLIFMDTWGIVNTYGAFQTIYELDILKSSTPSAIAWIGSIQGFILLLVGSPAGVVFDRGYFHSLVFSGAVLIFFGMLMTSFGTQYYQILLAQGVCVGLGTGMMYIPCVAVIASYFKRRRAFALGIVASGSGLGGVIFPAILLQLQPRIGFAWATRVIALIILVTLALAVALLRRRIVPAHKRKLIDATAFRDPGYVIFTLGLTVGFMGSYIPYYYISAYATSKTSASATLALYLVPILNAASVPGRIVPNIAADRIGSVNTIGPCVLVCGLLVFCWPAIHSLGALVAFALLYGFFAGTFVSLTSAALVNLTEDMRLVGTRVGMSFTCAGAGILIGNPVAGALINIPAGDFARMQFFSAALVMASGCLFVAARFAKVGMRWDAWI